MTKSVTFSGCGCQAHVHHAKIMKGSHHITAMEPNEPIVTTVARKVFDRLERFTFTGQLAHPELPPGKTCAAYVCEWLWAHGKQKHLDVHLCQHLYKEIFGEIPAKLRTFQRYPRQQQVPGVIMTSWPHYSTGGRRGQKRFKGNLQNV